MTLARYLFDQLWQRGVRHIFGLPGDYALNLFDALQADGRFTVVRLSHEPSIGFAADGCARGTGGLGVCCVTYGAGGLNMVNPVACAYAEEPPLVVISGGPGRAERRAGIHVHHEVKSFESQFNVYREVTTYSAILDDPRTAAAHILRALDAAAKITRPVYLEVPRDMVQAEIDASTEPAHVALRTDEAAADEAVAEILSRLRHAERPVLIVGVEVHRFNLREPVIRLAEAMAVPVASSFLGRGVFPARHPQFAGTYLGVVSPAPLREIVESSDCVLLLGELISDTTLGVSADRLSERNLILCAGRDVFIGHHRYQDAPLELVVTRLLASADLPCRGAWTRPDEEAEPPVSRRDEEPVTIAGVIDAVNALVDEHPWVPIVADTGDSLFATVEIRSNECVAPAYYATMGFAVPAALGFQISTGRRPLVLVGDGAFQMTGPELAHAREYGCNPVVIVLNNGSWEMLQAFVPNARYNTTAPWPFATLGEAWGARGFLAHTNGDLVRALREAWAGSGPALIEVRLARGDISPVLARFVAAFRQRLSIRLDP